MAAGIAVGTYAWRALRVEDFLASMFSMARSEGFFSLCLVAWGLILVWDGFSRLKKGLSNSEGAGSDEMK